MPATGDRAETTTSVPFEADPADAVEQLRPLLGGWRGDGDELETDVDPEAPVSSLRPADLDLSRGSEADLTEQLYELPYDDDVDR